jgi:hypothetical protein
VALRRELYKWRSLHLGIARRYLADLKEGTGGTSGPPYLKRSVRDTRSSTARPPCAGSQGSDHCTRRATVGATPNDGRPGKARQARSILSSAN